MFCYFSNAQSCRICKMQGLALPYLWSDFRLVCWESLTSMSTWEKLALCGWMQNKIYFLVLATEMFWLAMTNFAVTDTQCFRTFPPEDYIQPYTLLITQDTIIILFSLLYQDVFHC